MPDSLAVASKIRGLRDTGGPGALPGASDREEGWEGYIVAIPSGVKGYPILVAPRESPPAKPAQP